MNPKHLRRGEMFVFVTCVLEGLFPIIAKTVSGVYPPFFFLGVSAALAAIVLGAILVIQGEFKKSISLRIVWYCSLIALFIVVLPRGLIFTGSKYTSGINTALLMQTEMLTTFIIYGLLLKEKHELHHIVGALLVLTGTFFVIFNGTLEINKGDLMILLAVCIFPIGNLYAKRALKVITPMHVLFFRFLFASMILIPVALLFEDLSIVPAALESHGWLLVVYVLLMLVISKTFWYYGLRALTVSKAIYIISAFPAFSLMFAFIFLREIPNMYQFAGFVIAIIGVYTLIFRRQVSTASTDLV